MVFHLGSAQINLIVLVVLGFCVGVLGGFFGVGGGFIITPALNTLGAPMGLAIGTGLAQILGTSVIGSFKHRKLGNVDFKLGAILIVSMVPAVEVGKRLVLYLTKLGMAGDIVRWAYILLLFGFGAQMLRSYFAQRNTSVGLADEGGKRSFYFPPTVSFSHSGLEKVSVWLPIGLGLGVGVLSGFVGVGGGFVMVPLLDMMGVPTATAVGTSLFTILLGSGAYGTFTYGLSSDVSIGAALIMLLGASLGAQIGARAIVHAEVKRFRFLFAILLLLVAVSVVLKQVSTLHGLSLLDSYSPYLLMCAAIGMSLFITGFLVLSGQYNIATIAGSAIRAARLVKRFARKVTSASLVDADTIFEASDWPHLWRT